MHNLLLTLFLVSGCLSLHSQEKTKNRESPTVNNALILFDAFGSDTSLAKGWEFSSALNSTSPL